MPKPIILTLQIFPAAQGSTRVDMVATSFPDDASPAFNSMARALSDLAATIIAARDHDPLGTRSLRNEACLSSLPQNQNLDEGESL